jgi:2-polyprenyl-6-methoxyphenol hydroxylase-like FAD-dependent oxidoreductase
VRSLTRTRQVVIVGAGVGGLCAAIALRRSGLWVVVLELREVGAGILLWPNAMRVLQRLELGAAVEDAGAVAADAALRSSRGTALGASPAELLAAGVAAPTVVVHRGLLQTILLTALLLIYALGYGAAAWILGRSIVAGPPHGCWRSWPAGRSCGWRP